MRHIPRWAWILASFVTAAATSAAFGAESDPAADYERCMATARDDPEQGFELALAWRGLGGGPPAEHCIAVALLGLGQYHEAARRMETLARSGHIEAPLTVEILAQAAQAWLLGGQAERAVAVLDAALKMAPDDSGLLIDRAAALADQGRYAQAAADLDRVIAAEPDNLDALAFRASARRYLDLIEPAAADVERALALNPDHPGALLERGIIRRLKGDGDGARRDWLRILAVAPGTPAAASAQANLARLDVKLP